MSPSKTLASSYPNKPKLRLKLPIPVGNAPSAPTPSPGGVVENGISPSKTLASSYPNKPKLRLKLPIGDAPTTDPTPSPGGGKFRIVVSAEAVKVNAAPPRTKSKAKVREDTEWYVDEQAVNDDEEFMPSIREKQRVAASRKQAKRSAPAPQGNKAKRPKPAVAAVSRQPVSTSSRQRLMKRFR
jgi:hypothetical protein